MGSSSKQLLMYAYICKSSIAMYNDIAKSFSRTTQFEIALNINSNLNFVDSAFGRIPKVNNSHRLAENRCNNDD